MSWARLDDDFHDHPKVDGLSLAAVGLYTLCLTWAHRHRRDAATPGFIPDSRVTKLAGGKQTTLVNELTAIPSGKKHGMWEPVEGGYLIHNFRKYLPKERDPDERREAGRRGAKSRWQTDSKPDGNLPSTSMANPMATDSSRVSARAFPNPTEPQVVLPEPVPEPVPTTSGEQTAAPDVGALVAEFIDHCRERPPNQFIARIGREVRTLALEGIDPDAISGGLTIVADRGLQPTALAGAVHEHLNARPRAPAASRNNQILNAAMQRAQDAQAQQPRKAIG